MVAKAIMAIKKLSTTISPNSSIGGTDGPGILDLFMNIRFGYSIPVEIEIYYRIIPCWYESDYVYMIVCS